MTSIHLIQGGVTTGKLKLDILLAVVIFKGAKIVDFLEYIPN